MGSISSTSSTTSTCCSPLPQILASLGFRPSTTSGKYFTPLPIAWVTVRDVDDKTTWEFASCFYNACADGGRAFVPPSGGRRNDHRPALAIGFRDDAFAERVRKSGELVVHTATFPHRRRIQQLLAGGPVQASQNEICSAVGVSCGRIAAAPVAFSVKVIKETKLGNGNTAFYFTFVGVHVSKSIVVGGKVDAQALQAIGAADPSGRVFMRAKELHTIVFPDEKDAEGRWIIPQSYLTPPRSGSLADSDLSYVPPQLPNLEFNPLKAMCVPRPIGWISTRGPSGDNLAPYSFFGYLAPDVVFYGVGGGHIEDGEEKDALRDARASGVFAVNLCSWDLRNAMSASSAEAMHAEDEFEISMTPESAKGHAKALKGPCSKIDAPCVKNAPLRLECKVLELVPMADKLDVAVVGRVIHVEGINDRAVASRGGYFDYYRIGNEHVFDPLDTTASW
eukprot:gnl/MRDRNA2_/MRDRNA2_27124_c0_seq1.p1 gnl/MRDRNA2_/MRDRNA2_27124_c0~~gnl/MRDRNA2_/MRDRNA2_27124_c0_seq1.p1  ORF type:complete len:450 (-),score=83.62 gnl/MRDRNA2_/MRDRNA2_27124_c0_seq1:199-1548(-)